MKVLNFNDPYVDSKGNVSNLEDVLSDSSVKESVDYINNNLNASNAGAHNSIYRGKYLGNALTTEQKEQISAGTFNDLYIGDYWTINRVNYRIASFDYWLFCGSTSLNKHHIIIIPDVPLYDAQMNTTNVTTGGYVGSAMYNTNLEQAKTIVNNAFGSAVVTHKELLINEVTSGYPSSGSWYDSSIEIPNEIMFYGSYINMPAGNGTIVPYLQTIDRFQLALFSFCPQFISNRRGFWLRDPVSETNFSYIDVSGRTGIEPASSSLGVRPVFGITG